MGVHYQHQLVEALKAYGDDISVDKLVSAPTEAMQVAVQYGKQRWQAMGMALTIAGIIGFNVNQVFASSTGASAQSAQSNADSSGSALGGSAGLSGAKQQMFNETTSAKAFNDVVSQSNGNQGYYDNASMQQTVSQLDAQGAAKGKLDAVKDMANVSSTSEYVAQTSTEQSIGATTASRAEAQALGVSVERMKELDSGSVLNANEAKSLNEKFGTNSFKDGMSVKDFAFTQNGEVSNLTLSGAGAKGTESYVIDNKGDVVKSDIDGSMSEHHDKTKTANVTDQANVDVEKNKINQANVINEAKKVDDKSTKSDSSTSVIQGKTTTTGSDTLNETVRGIVNKETVSSLGNALQDKGSFENYKTQLVQTMETEYSKQRTQGVATDASASVHEGASIMVASAGLDAKVSASGAEKVSQNQLRQEVDAIGNKLEHHDISKEEFIKEVGQLRQGYADRQTGVIAGNLNDTGNKAIQGTTKMVNDAVQYGADKLHQAEEHSKDSQATINEAGKNIKDKFM